jgi:hypothetical protein
MDKEIKYIIEKESAFIIRCLLLELIQNDKQLQEKLKTIYYKHR